MLYRDTIVPIESIYTPQVLSPWPPLVDEEADGELRHSLETVGQLGNVLVVQTGGGERYALIAGRRRYDAARALGWAFLSVKILPVGSSRSRLFATFLAENLHRRHLAPGGMNLGLAAEARALEMIGWEDRPESVPVLAGSRLIGWPRDPRLAQSDDRDEETS